jgi:hypothetical protein
MNKYKLLIVLFLLFENYACNFSKSNNPKGVHCCIQSVSQYSQNPVSFSELVRFAYFNRNEQVFPELCRLLNDSILSRKEKTLLWTTSKIDTVSHCIFWKFIHADPKLFKGLLISSRFLFMVCITDENDILIDDCKNDISTIKQQAIEYLFYPEEKFRHITIERHNIDLIGEIEVARTGVLLSRDARNGLAADEWKLFFDCLHELMLAFEEERNKKSVEIWGVEYHLLSCDKMEALTNVVDYNIIIDFFQTVVSYCNPPPPPPDNM